MPLTIRDLLESGPIALPDNGRLTTHEDAVCSQRWDIDHWSMSNCYDRAEPLFNAIIAATETRVRQECEARVKGLVEALETCITFYSVDWAETVQSFDIAKVKAALTSLTPPTPKAEELEEEK